MIQKNNLDAFLLGSTFFGTGGGGCPKKAKEVFLKIFEKKEKLIVESIQEFDEDALFITAFGVGSITNCSDPSIPIQKAFQNLSKFMNKKIAGIIPVEIGPLSLAITFFLADILDLPVIDADIVGGRSTPEVFLETITLFDIPRTPFAIANNNGDEAMLLKSSSLKSEESFMRSFAELSGGDAQVVGYPMSKQQIIQSCEQKTISEALFIGKMLETKNINELLKTLKGKILFEGVVNKKEEKMMSGFTGLDLFLSNSQSNAKVFIKNENLILWINDEVVLTCPELLIMLDENNMPIYNADLKENMQIQILGIPAKPLWQSKKAKELFCPKTFGFPFNEVSLTTESIEGLVSSKKILS
ncbi:MAG: hypothetical protein COV59_01925 [Candidatus Magasanikbacteria bacterium CG11_big_fil_rev_8_21_14_0_20_39_34]|uniref:DUF917 domain-containing protein n=1 Tax=Candidatus Magasanikbacteria bacterium CG11_big_fil_rev_8_21_14_0_20_39_34 TaxID=1974653 RepID=A0A2H0N4V1_9BACT|nr:MAG: hypothetical protein COV59_01925 [Candidatus Magasanikbacteria bacterium CG11_big_fil_rev_8_21_14_0_20_39_34]